MPELREALEAAMAEEPDQPVTETPAEAPTPTPSPEPAPAVEAPTPSPVEPVAAKEEKVRDSLGRFVPKDAAKVTATPVAPAAVPAEVTQVSDKAPASWTVTARQHWGALPPEVRGEVFKREQEVQQALQVSAQARQFAGEFFNAVAPYKHAIQVETGGNALQAVVGLMDTATRLRFGTPGEKASIIAHLVKTYGVGIEDLDGALVGVSPPQQNGFDPNAVQQIVQQQLQPLFQRAQQRQQMQEREITQTVSKELTDFAADPKHEFYEDVRDMMADIIEVQQKRGVQLTLDQAYNHACKLHPEVSKVLESREAAKSATTLNSAAQRAKAAAVSVRGSAPVGNPNQAEPSSVRDAIEAAIESHSRV